jgi:alpha-L-fucosidase
LLFRTRRAVLRIAASIISHWALVVGHSCAALFLAAGTFTAPVAFAQDEPWLKARPERMREWQDLGFGLFMHWDPSSILGVEISWHRQSPFNGPIPDEVYDNLYRSFYPGQFDAAAIAQTAKAAGMRYIVITAKHHGGFSMFDSAHTDYDIMGTPFKRDIIKELADATRAAGLLFGIYYSQPDWHHPAFLAKDWDAYNKFFYGQMRELCTNYGEISMIFFDAISYGSSQYKPKELFKMIRELQPNVVINNRCGLPGDYDTPEQVVGAFQTHRPWETCMTLSTSWSWKTYDKIRSPAECVRLLVMTAGSGGNLLLNVGPMPTGQIEPRQAEVLQKVGNWLSRNGHALLAHRAGPYKPALWGASVHKDHTIYLHILSWADLPDALPALPAKITSITHLDGRRVTFTHDERGLRLSVPAAERDQLNTILKLTLDPSGPAAKDLAPLLVPTRSLARLKPVAASTDVANAKNLVDDDPATQWVSDSRQCWAEIDLGADRRFSRVDIREEGHAWETRTKSFEILVRPAASSADTWQTIERGTSIGSTYTKKIPPVTARYVRLKINDSGALPRFSEIQLYD